MVKALLEKLKEAVMSILPATIAILIVAIIIGVPFVNKTNPNNSILIFLVCAILLIVGLAFFTLGAQGSMLFIAEKIGRHIVSKRKLFFLVFIGFLIGFMITIAEPALWVLSGQFPINEWLLIGAVAVGVGIFLVIALLRIIFQINMRTIIIVFYSIIFAVVFILPAINPDFAQFIPFAFDASGVTTGPMAVPFIMSLGLGVASARSDKNAEEESFGLVGIASMGPIVAILVLGVINNAPLEVPDDNILSVGGAIWSYIKSMGIAILPFVAFFVVYQIFVFKFPKKRVISIFVAFLFTYIGLVLFLAGADAGFVAIGKEIGRFFGSSDFAWALIPIGAVFGIVVVSAEPSVIVLNKQVEDVTSGAITKRVMKVFMSIGMMIAVALAMVRVVTGINILWILLPGYIIAVVLSFFVPKVFTAIAFDSGGAVSGAVTSTFLVSLALGATQVIEGGNVFTDAFGLVAFVAMMPLISIQVLGLIYKVRDKKQISTVQDDDIIELEEN